MGRLRFLNVLLMSEMVQKAPELETVNFFSSNQLKSGRFILKKEGLLVILVFANH